MDHQTVARSRTRQPIGITEHYEDPRILADLGGHDPAAFAKPRSATLPPPVGHRFGWRRWRQILYIGMVLKGPTRPVSLLV